MKLFFSVMLMLFGWATASAQTYSLRGTAIDFHDNTTLNKVKIEVAGKTVFSDSDGKFLITKIKAGRYLITATHPDCEVFSENIVIKEDTEITLNLEHHSHDIETVTLHGKHQKPGIILEKTIDQNVLSRNRTENLGNVLTNISGVGTLKTGNNIAKPLIHGLYGSRIAIINNGVKMAEQEWGVEHAPNVDINNFEHIDVIKGAAALKYGSDAVGGIVVLEPEISRKKDTLKGAVNLSGISNGRGIGFDINLLKSWQNGWVVKTNGGYKKLGDQKTPDYLLMNTGLNFNSFNFSVQNIDFKKGIAFDYSLTNQTIGIFRGSHTGNLEDFYNAMNTPEPIYQRPFSYDIDNPKQEIQHHIAKISAFNRFKNFGKLSASYSFQFNHRKEFDLRRGELNAVPSLDLELVTNQLNINHLLERKNFELETGIDGTYQNNFSNPDTKARRLIPNYDKYSAGIYSVLKHKISKNFNAEAGLRYDFNFYNAAKWYDVSEWENQYAAQFPEFYMRTEGNRVLTNPKLKYNNLSYNVGLDFHPSQHFSAKINYARVARTPNPAELFADGLHHSAAIIERGDLTLKNETGHQINLDLSTKMNVLNGLNIQLNPYAFFTKNFISEIPVGIQNTIRGTFPVWKYRQVDVEMLGIDLDILLKINEDFTYSSRGSYLYGQDLTNDEPLILMMPPNFSNKLEFNKKAWNNFYFSVENRNVLEQKRFPIHNAEISVYENGASVSKTVDFSTPPKAYSLWNLQTGIHLAKNFSAGLSVSNLFDTKYRDYLNRLRFFADETGRNIILNFKYQF